MAKVKIYLDPIGNTLNLWWGNKKDAYESIEVKNPYRDDVVIVDKKGRPISLEIIGFFPEELDIVEQFPKEMIMTYLETGKFPVKLLPKKVQKLDKLAK